MVDVRKQHRAVDRGGNRQSFLYGALLLTAGMAVVKVIGALFKVPLQRVVGEYGMGVFHVAYSFYGPVFSLATAGFPVAVSRLVSESATLGRWNDVRLVRRAAMPLFLGVGVGGMALITLAAPWYCRTVIGDPNALYAMLALAPAILFACVGAVYRGYYEGLRDMAPTAVSQIVEALVKLVVGLGGALAAARLGEAAYARTGQVLGLAPASPGDASLLVLSLAAAGGVAGVACGAGVSTLYLWLRGRRGDGITLAMLRGAPRPAGKKAMRRRLWKITLPVAAGSILLNAAGLVDAAFLQGRLAALLERDPQGLLAACPGMIPEAYLRQPQALPTFLYGCYTMALTLYLLVPAITQAFGVSALPAVTQAWARGNRGELAARMASVLRVTALFCFPAGVGLSALAGPVTRLLYGDSQSWPITARALGLLGLASLAAAMSTPLSSMLQAVGRADLPVKLLPAALAIKLGVNWWLCAIPQVNILGAAAGTLCCYLFLTAAQLWCLRRAAGVALSPVKLFAKPLASALVCGCAARLAYGLLGRVLSGSSWAEGLCAGASVAAGALVYLAGLLILRSIAKNDLFMLPQGQKIAKMLEKQGWI